MENVSLEVIATCGHPPELQGQKVRDIQVFTSCPENSSPPDQEVVSNQRPPKVKKPKPSLPKVAAVKAKPKAKVSKPTKKQPQRKHVAPKVAKKKKTL